MWKLFLLQTAEKRHSDHVSDQRPISGFAWSRVNDVTLHTKMQMLKPCQLLSWMLMHLKPTLLKEWNVPWDVKIGHQSSFLKNDTHRYVHKIVLSKLVHLQQAFTPKYEMQLQLSPVLFVLRSWTDCELFFLACLVHVFTFNKKELCPESVVSWIQAPPLVRIPCGMTQGKGAPRRQHQVDLHLQVCLHDS